MKIVFSQRHHVIVLSLVAMFAVSFSFGQSQLPIISLVDQGQTEFVPNVDQSTIPEATTSGGISTPFLDAQWDLQFEYGVSDSVGYFSNAGAFWTGTEFWVSKWNSDTLASLDTFGSLIQVFTIPGVSGVRSITSDGNNLFLGTATSTITEVNPVTKTVVNTISLTGAAFGIGSRFITYDPTLDSGNGGFYVGNFTSNIASVSMTGATLNVILQSTHGRVGMYGAAYDGTSAGGPYLWVFEQPTTPSNTIISQLQLPAGTWTGVSFDVEADLGQTGSLAGGLFITSGIVPGQSTIGGLVQGAPNVLFGYELDFIPVAVDAQLTRVEPLPEYTIIPTSQIEPTYFFASIFSAGNLTLFSARAKAQITDFDTGTIIYSDSSGSQSMTQATNSNFVIGPWIPADTGSYEVIINSSTGTQVDENPTNDSITFVFSVTDSVLSKNLGPVISGFGVGAGPNQNAAIGSKFDLGTDDVLTSISGYFSAPPIGDSVVMEVYSISQFGGAPLTLLGTTSAYTFQLADSNGVFVTLPLENLPYGLPLSSGDFFISVKEDGSNIGVGVTGEVYNPGNLWYRADNISNGIWISAPNEVVLQLFPNFGEKNVPLIEFIDSEITVNEDTGSFNIFVDLDQALSNTNTVSLSVLSGSAQFSQDYTFPFSNPLTLTFPAGSADSLGIPFTIIDDFIVENQEYFELVLSNPSFPVGLGTQDTLRINIVDNDISPTVQFIDSKMIVSEDTGTVSILLGIDDPSPISSTVTLGVLASGTANWLDYSFSTTAVTFPGDSSSNQMVNFLIVDDVASEPLEFLELVLFNPGAGVLIGSKDTLIIEIVDNDLPIYNIATLTNDSNSDGIPDSLSVSGEIRGVVYGVNLASSGLQFTLIDETDGIQIFSFSSVNNYSVTEGDSLHIQGSVTQFNGLTQFNPDVIQLISQGNPLQPASVQILPGEKDESRLIVMNCVTLVDAAAWPTDGSDANLEVRNGVDTFTVRIDKETNIDGSTAPMGWFNVTGIGGQFDTSTPFLSGYQLLPRYVEDFDFLPNLSGGFSIAADQLDEGAGTYNINFSLKNAVPDTAEVSLRIGTASTATEATDFTLDAFFQNFVGCGDSASYSGMLTIVDDADIEGDETIEIILEASIGGSIVVADTLSITITETDNIFDGAADLGISIYPNPGSQEVIISAEERILSVELLDMTGRVLAGKVPNTVEESFDTETLPSGVYSLRVETGKGVGTYRWIKR